MAFNIPRTYYELLEIAKAYDEVPKPTAEELLTELGFSVKPGLADSPVFYMLDYTTGKYLYVDPCAQLVLGYENQFIKDRGPIYWTSLWKRNDLKIFNEIISPLTYQILKDIDPSESSRYSFTFNYRMQTSSGNYMTILQRSSFYLSDQNIPLASAGFVLDISQFKEDTKIVFTVEKVNQDRSILDKELILKNVYFPEMDIESITRREREVLQFIYEGLSSKQIAVRLHVSLNTINNHRKNLLAKTGCANSSSLIKFALKEGLI